MILNRFSGASAGFLGCSDVERVWCWPSTVFTVTSIVVDSHGCHNACDCT